MIAIVKRAWAAWERACDHVFPQETAEDINRNLLAHAQRELARRIADNEYHEAMAGMYRTRIARLTRETNNG